ncbi:hypothetical protein Bbelb_024710 [Branchiostoma belcheri]|nr:hypothetical protein Bbelb_024710 [Branchiostoma belcheri]
MHCSALGGIVVERWVEISIDSPPPGQISARHRTAPPERIKGISGSNRTTALKAEGHPESYYNVENATAPALYQLQCQLCGSLGAELCGCIAEGCTSNLHGGALQS